MFNLCKHEKKMPPCWTLSRGSDSEKHGSTPAREDGRRHQVVISTWVRGSEECARGSANAPHIPAIKYIRYAI